MKRLATLIVLGSIAASAVFAKSTPYFSPYDDCQQVCISNLDTAKKTVLISCYGLTNQPIADELVKLHDRGVNVRICVDKTQSAGRNDKTKTLASKGIEVVVKPVAVLEHNKFMVIDQTEVMTGSFNFTASACKQDNNLVVITDEPTVVEKYRAAWVRIHDRDKSGTKVRE